MKTQEITSVTTTANGFDSKAYIQIARIDHWFKNVFMLFGVVFALFHDTNSLSVGNLPLLLVALLATCLAASSNYVINEIRDAEFDRLHPVKKNRPIPSGRVNLSVAYAEWLVLMAAGLGLAATVNVPFLITMSSLLVMGILYNVRPFRLKDWPYLDVLSESVNNPIRLLLGWFVIIPSQLPSVSLLMAYWFIGAFFMAVKRFAEYRNINNPEIAGSYRNSFRYYDEGRLLTSIFFYITLFSLFFGIFIIRYHFELILCTPFVAGFTSYYIKLGLKRDSPVQNPERLYRARKFLAYAILSLVVFILLLFIRIPLLYYLFNVQPSQLVPLWTL